FPGFAHPPLLRELLDVPGPLPLGELDRERHPDVEHDTARDEEQQDGRRATEPPAPTTGRGGARRRDGRGRRLGHGEVLEVARSIGLGRSERPPSYPSP